MLNKLDVLTHLRKLLPYTISSLLRRRFSRESAEAESS
jgi:hypothetical protein